MGNQASAQVACGLQRQAGAGRNPTVLASPRNTQGPQVVCRLRAWCKGRRHYKSTARPPQNKRTVAGDPGGVAVQRSDIRASFAGTVVTCGGGQGPRVAPATVITTGIPHVRLHACRPSPFGYLASESVADNSRWQSDLRAAGDTKPTVAAPTPPEPINVKRGDCRSYAMNGTAARPDRRQHSGDDGPGSGQRQSWPVR